MNISKSGLKNGRFMLCMIASAAISMSTYAADPEQGASLYHDVQIDQTINGVTYEGANCETCHQTTVFTRPDRLVDSYTKLEAFVERCNTNLDVGWFPEDVADVASFLNKQFYKLTD